MTKPGSVVCVALTIALFAVTGCEELDEAAKAVIAKADYFVAPDGSDAWSGRLAVPNADKTDGPFATIEGARDAIRKLPKTKPVTVLIRGGVYRLDKPILFAPQDSGTAAAPVTYAAYPGEKPILSGGREITGWKKQSGKIWAAQVPEAKGGKWAFRRLYVDDYRRTLARTPNDGEFYRISGKPAPMKDPKTGKEIDASKFSFRFKPGDIKNRPNLNEVDAFVCRNWETAMLPIKSVDEKTNTVVFTGPMKWELRTGLRYFLENHRDFLDAPGEWFLDRKAGTLYYYPQPGEDMAKVSVVAPVVKEFMRIEGKPKEGKFVDHLKFEGISFRHSDYALEPTGHSDWQAAVTIPAAIQINGARYCSFERCEFFNIGQYAVWFERGCTHNRFVQNEIFDTGAGGVRVGEPGGRKDEAERTSHHTISNNFIHDTCSVFYGAIPVWVGQSSDNVISHNEICDSNYTGISVGWSWGFRPTQCHRNLIEYNHLHHLGRGMLYDMAAIYTLGISTGTIIRNNHIHHIWDWPEGYGAGGIYPDEGSSGILIENNVVYCNTAGGLTVHYGRDLVVRNNIFAFARDRQLAFGRKDKKSSVTFEHNIVYYTEGVLMTPFGSLTADYNLYFNAAGEPVTFLKDMDLKAWQAKGYDKHSVIADPMFVDAKKFDFRLKPGSPALKLGFKPIDISKAGLVGDPEWVNKPKKIKRGRTMIPPKYEPPPQLIDDGFEESLVGASADLARTYGETQNARIRVTDETAAIGKRSLKFVDASGLDQPWNPHMHYAPRLKKGIAHESFDLRWEKGAVVGHEWRTWPGGAPYHAGPSLAIDGKGSLTAGGKPVATLPPGKWVHFEIAARLGKQADGKYDLTVTIPGQPPKRMKDIACDPKFNEITWLGFTSNATKKAVFYLDNIKLNVQTPAKR
ncbi:MAG: hypothetical protein GXP25_03805 [Planctomycetes bacterium]|nr:hypothetical protein [Planctomycetota bacterium]